MRKLHLALLAAAVVSGTAFAQTPAPAPAKAPAAMAPGGGTVKAVQPGLFDVAGPRVNEVIAAGIEKITATPDKGRRSIAVQSPWGDSFYGWPKNVKPVAFTIEVGKPAGGATISRLASRTPTRPTTRLQLTSSFARRSPSQMTATNGWTTPTTKRRRLSASATSSSRDALV